jgi:hypothetical protein
MNTLYHSFAAKTTKKIGFSRFSAVAVHKKLCYTPDRGIVLCLPDFGGETQYGMHLQGIE